MMHSDAKTLKARGDKLFADKLVVDSRNQDIAENFFPERADFTVTRHIGERFGEHLMSGYPSLVRRQFANNIGAMLRPKEWFKVTTKHDQEVSHEARAWLEWATKLQSRAMADRVARFDVAAKDADHDFATFGACAISVEMNMRDMALLYRCWHLRDMAWDEDSYGQISSRHRNWKPTYAELARNGKRFSYHPKMAECMSDDKKAQIKAHVRHVCIRSDEFSDKIEQPWMSLYIDCENEHVMEEVPSWTQIYVTPRWGQMSINPYGISPAVVCALPDARLLQAMTLTMLDAGERAANPPMVGVSDAIRGDLALYPGGFTSVDSKYDERLGEVLRPLTTDKSGLPYGFEMLDRTGEFLREAFYLNTLSMPPAGGPDMTAYEVGQRVQEYVRNALPVFAPMEAEYNAALCEITFETLLRNYAFENSDMPRELEGEAIDFKFKGALSDMDGQEKGRQFLEMMSLVGQAMAMDESVARVPKMKDALADVFEGIGIPAKWTQSTKDLEAAEEQDAQMREAQNLMAAMQQGAETAKITGEAAQALGAAA